MFNVTNVTGGQKPPLAEQRHVVVGMDYVFTSDSSPVVPVLVPKKP